MTETIRWGILGASNFALQHMGPAIHMARGATLAALATRSPGKADPFRAFCPEMRVLDSYDALIEDPDIDAIYIPLPNTLHAEWTEKAIRQGSKHVLCEKPIAMSAAQIDHLISLRDLSGRHVAEAYMIVHHPQWQRIKALLEQGVVGDLLHVNGLFSYNNAADPDNIRNKPGTGGGGIPDIGVYTFGSARFATGLEPEDISAHITWENDVDVKAEVTARFGKASFFSVVSMRMQPYQEMLFHGSRGFIRVCAPFNAGVFAEAKLEYKTEDGPLMVETWPQVNQYVIQVENFGNTIRTGADYPWRLEDARGTQAMIDKVFAAAGKD